ncbi:MAG TPA: hypothetical protein VIM67_04535, partial [Terriglobus sp.]
ETARQLASFAQRTSLPHALVKSISRGRPFNHVELIVRHDVTARIQEAHKLLLHTICELVELRLHEAAVAGEQPLT